MQPVSYAQAGDVHIAYQSYGSPGGTDVVMVSGMFFPMEVLPEDRLVERLLDGLTQLGRLVVFDKRGVGMSDPYTDWSRPSVDQWSDDLIAVIETAELRKPVVFAWDLFGVGRLAASKRPDLVGKLVLLNPISTLDPARASVTAKSIQDNIDQPDSGIERRMAPSRIDDPSFAEWVRRAGRLGASPATASRLWQEMFTSEVNTPEDVSAPTLVIHRTDSMLPRESCVGVAEAIDGARFVELPGADMYPIAGDVDALLAEITSFATGSVQLPAPDRVVGAVLFCDMVGSTEQAADMGDERWRSLLDHHDEVVRHAVARHGGRVVKYTGDGVLAILPSATGALGAAETIRSELGVEGLQLRLGVHVGEVDERGEDVSGIAVNIAARIMHEAASGEVLVSESVRLATAGSSFVFDQARSVELKGVPGPWTLHRWAGSA